MSTAAPLPADLDAIARLARHLVFVCGPDHPVTVAMRQAATSGKPEDVAKARALFVGLKPGLRRAVLTMTAA